MASARNFAAGHGLSTPSPNGYDVPLTHFPPGYSLALALTACFFHHDIFLGARWLNIFLFAVNTILIAGWVYKRTDSLPLTLFAAGISISSLDLLRIYSMAWSEPLFLFFTFGGLWMLEKHLDRASMAALLMAALCTAAAVLTRYAGIAGIGAGLLILFVCQKKSTAQKLKETAVFGSVSGLPMVGWFLRNFFLTHDATNRKFVFHPVLHQAVQAAQSTLSLWLFQGRLPQVWAIPVGVLVIVTALGIGWRYKKSPFFSTPLVVPVIFSLSYIFSHRGDHSFYRSAASCAG